MSPQRKKRRRTFPVSMPSESPTEPAGERKIFDVVVSSHSEAGEPNALQSEYKAQCLGIGKGFGEEEHDVFVTGGSGLHGGASENHENPSTRQKARSHTTRQDSSQMKMERINDDGCAAIDTGCQRMAVGADTLYRLASKLPRILKVGTFFEEHRFRSVNGTSATTHSAAVPTSLGIKGSHLQGRGVKTAIFDFTSVPASLHGSPLSRHPKRPPPLPTEVQVLSGLPHRSHRSPSCPVEPVLKRTT